MPQIDFAYVVPMFLILLLSLSVHEAAHAWTADRLGDPTARQLGRITLNPLAHIDWIGTVLFPLLALLSRFPLLGWAKPVPVNVHNLKAPRRDFAIVAAAGPISNLLVACVLASVFRLVASSDGLTESRAVYFLQDAIALNVVLAVFNLIPVPPLDGGNVLSGFLPGEAARALNQLRPYGFLILYALMFSGALVRYVFPIADTITDWLL